MFPAGIVATDGISIIPSLFISLLIVGVVLVDTLVFAEVCNAVLSGFLRACSLLSQYIICVEIVPL